jgi:CRP/FNR family transcriptional regulator, cyclic AMP receptor protein
VSAPSAAPSPTAPNFLDLLGAEERRALEAVAVRRRFPRGVAVFRQGDDAGAVYVVMEGRVKVTTCTPDGREVLLGFPGPGEVLGELSAANEDARSATVTVVEPVEAVTLSGAAFRALVEHHPAIALVLLRIVSRRLLAADRRCVEFSAFDVLGRVARRLSELAESAGRPAPDGIEITIPLTQEELASWTGASREAVSRSLTTLRNLGWIAVERRRITVCDAEALSRHTAG